MSKVLSFVGNLFSWLLLFSIFGVAGVVGNYNLPSTVTSSNINLEADTTTLQRWAVWYQFKRGKISPVKVTKLGFMAVADVKIGDDARVLLVAMPTTGWYKVCDLPVTTTADDEKTGAPVATL